MNTLKYHEVYRNEYLDLNEAVPLLGNSSSALIISSVYTPCCVRERMSAPSGGIGEPSDIGSAPASVQTVAAEKAVREQQSAERGHPEAESIQGWKCHIARLAVGFPVLLELR